MEILEKLPPNYLNDDVVMEILEKLPPESVLRFKSVSRRWRDLISSSTFLNRYAAAHRGSPGGLVAFFQQSGEQDVKDPTTAKRCNALPIRNKLGNYITVPEHVGRFVSSSNGLILCSSRRGAVVTYHVGNPLTGKFVKLPPPLVGKGCLDVRQSDAHSTTRPDLLSSGLICEENSNEPVPVYTVLRAGEYGERTGDKGKIIHIDSYSSKTGQWSAVTELVSADRVELFNAPPVVANGIVHWYSSKGIAVYDPSDGDDRRLQLIRTPNYNNSGRDAVTRSVDDDVLWLAVQLRQKLLFYMLPKEGGYKRGVVIKAKEWVLMQEANIYGISGLMKKNGLVACKEVKLECLIPHSGSEIVAVLRQEEKLFLYNVQRKSIHQFDYSGRYNNHHSLCPYFQSSFLSSYSLL